MKRFLIFATLSCCMLLSGTAMSAQIAGCQFFPDENIWNTPIDTLPVDANSDAYVNTIGGQTGLHPDFGSGLWAGGPIGIPYVEVPGTQAMVPVTFGYDDESDPGPYPIPPDAPIEGGPDSNGDRHVLIVDRDNCMLYELYDAFPQEDGSWTAGSGAIYDLNSNALRPQGWTSADAAGLPILSGLVRYEEVAAGEIRHAIRFTAPQTRREYVWPARHFASSLSGSQYPPMGQRFRLKADFDISGFDADVQVILRAFKKYGIILADNGSSWYISGVPDERWDNDALSQLKQVTGSDFEAVDVSSLMVSPDSGQVHTSGIPQAPSELNSVLNGVDISLTWSDNSGNEETFVLERRVDSGNYTVLAGTLPANTNMYSDTGLATGHTYTYRVKAQNAFGDSSYSNEAAQYVSEVSFSLTVASTSGGAVTVPGEGAFTYDAGAAVNLVATPEAGYEFMIWTGDVADLTSPTTTVTLDADKTVYANFARMEIAYVADIAMSQVSRRNRNTARAVALIRQMNGNPVPGAAVTGHWSGLVSGRVSGVTGADGTVTFTTRKILGSGWVTFTVTDVSTAGYVYDPEYNVETEDAIRIGRTADKSRRQAPRYR